MKTAIDNLVSRTGRTQQELADALGVTRPAVWQALHGLVRSSRVFALVDALSGSAPGTCAALAEACRRARVEANAKRFAQCAMAHRAEEASRTSGGGLRSVSCHTAGKDNQEEKETTR